MLHSEGNKKRRQYSLEILLARTGVVVARRVVAGDGVVPSQVFERADALAHQVTVVAAAVAQHAVTRQVLHGWPRQHREVHCRAVVGGVLVDSAF